MRFANIFNNRIFSKEGVDERIFVEIGGQEQYLLIRGENVNNPVIIWLHGGPTGADSFINYDFTKHLVDDYTVVCWDQRGCGRTYFRNKKSDPNNETVSFERSLEDLNEIVEYVKGRFSPSDIILIGHSYGTMLGSKYAFTYPEKISAFIGVGQVVSMESDIYSYNDALQKAKAAGDDTSEMENAYSIYTQNPTLANLMAIRYYTKPYHKAPKEKNVTWLGLRSSYMGIDDFRWVLKQQSGFEKYTSLNKSLFDYIMVTDVREYGLNYPVPVGFISGSEDWTTPADCAEQYFDEINAPSKQFIFIEGCGHAPQHDEPKEFAEAVKQILKSALNN